MIKPTVGRKVWFIPSQETIDGHQLVLMVDVDNPLTTQPLDATIIAVCSDTVVTLNVIDAGGNTHYYEEVELLQDDTTPPDFNDYAMWMPYQVSQAAKDSGGVVQPVTGTVV